MKDRAPNLLFGIGISGATAILLLLRGLEDVEAGVLIGFVVKFWLALATPLLFLLFSIWIGYITGWDEEKVVNRIAKIIVGGVIVYLIVMAIIQKWPLK